MDEIDRAATAIREGSLVVYPTETVYGLGADALDADAVRRVFETKGRSPDKPVSLAVPDVARVSEYARPTDREERFMREFLPGPVTVLLAAREMVPDVLTAGRSRVGVRVPDQPTALALLERVAPLTATSANRSGTQSARRVADLEASFRERVAVVLDDGDRPGTESTVVDVSEGVIHRRGQQAGAIEAWLDRVAE